MTIGTLLLDRLRRLSPRTRAVIYDVVLGVAIVLAVLSWGLPLLDVTRVWRIDLTELDSIAVLTSAAAAVLARLNVPTEEVEYNPQHRA